MLVKFTRVNQVDFCLKVLCNFGAFQANAELGTKKETIEWNILMQMPLLILDWR
jgi:hypothetical protein